MMKYSGARVSSRASAMMSNPFTYEYQLVDTGEGWDYKQNPSGKTILARRGGTCPISGDKIHPGDSITKTDEGWALTQHVHGAMSNPRRTQWGAGAKKGQPFTYGNPEQSSSSPGPTVYTLTRKSKDYDLWAMPHNETIVNYHADKGADGMGGEYVGSVILKGDKATFAGFSYTKPFTVKILKPARATTAISEVVSALNAGYDDNAATVNEFAKGVLQIGG